MRFILLALLGIVLGTLPLSGQETSTDTPAAPAANVNTPEEPTAEETPPSDTPAPSAVMTKEFDLNTVVDDTWLTNEESSAYYGLLNQAIQTPAAELQQQGSEFVQRRLERGKIPTFPDMLKNPAEWRGQPVTISGHVLQTVEYQPAPNPYGIGTLFESSLYIEDSQGHPITVIFTEKPENLPLSGELIDGVQVSGYFFKVYWYPSVDKQTRKAPLILARTVSVRPPFNPGPVVPPIVSWGLLGLMALFVVGVIIRIFANDQKRRAAQRAKATGNGPADLTRIVP